MVFSLFVRSFNVSGQHELKTCNAQPSLRFSYAQLRPIHLFQRTNKDNILVSHTGTEDTKARFTFIDKKSVLNSTVFTLILESRSAGNSLDQEIPSPV